MKTREVLFVRIYTTEKKGEKERFLKLLHDREKVCGVTVYRAISGFGKSGHLHHADLLDLSLDLPIVIEFFDEREKAERILADLEALVEPGHMVSWPARVHFPPEEDPPVS